jgi:hypothetical protein
MRASTGGSVDVGYAGVSSDGSYAGVSSDGRIS